MVIVYWIDLFDTMYSGTWYLLKVLLLPHLHRLRKVLVPNEVQDNTKD